MMEVSVVKPTLALDFNNLICAEAKMEDGGWTTETRQLELEWHTRDFWTELGGEIIQAQVTVE